MTRAVAIALWWWHLGIENCDQKNECVDVVIEKNWIRQRRRDEKLMWHPRGHK